MPTGLSTSNAAPVSDIFLMTQSTAAATPNMIEPPFSVRSRGLRRLSMAAELTGDELCLGKGLSIDKVKLDSDLEQVEARPISTIE